MVLGNPGFVVRRDYSFLVRYDSVNTEDDTRKDGIHQIIMVVVQVVENLPVHATKVPW